MKRDPTDLKEARSREDAYLEQRRREGDEAAKAAQHVEVDVSQTPEAHTSISSAPANDSIGDVPAAPKVEPEAMSWKEMLE